MTAQLIEEKYFDWMCHITYESGYVENHSYDKLLSFLHNTVFTYEIDMDENRFEDGIDLRYRFLYYNNLPESKMEFIDSDPCTVFEMMLALAIRLEENIMGDPDIGDRTALWFWEMVKNLGLFSMTNENFNIDEFELIMDRFLSREYGRDGKGGLFTIKRYRGDLRNEQIWNQACMYLNRLIEEGQYDTL